jgi:hypothetical protein
MRSWRFLSAATVDSKEHKVIKSDIDYRY